MIFDEEEVAAAFAAAEPVPFFAIELLKLAEAFGTTAGSRGEAEPPGLDGWIVRLGRDVLLLTTGAGLWQAELAAWDSWAVPTLDWRRLPFALAPEAFEQAVTAAAPGAEAIVTLARPLRSLPDRVADLAKLVAGYTPPLAQHPWCRENRRLYDAIAEELARP